MNACPSHVTAVAKSTRYWSQYDKFSTECIICCLFVLTMNYGDQTFQFNHTLKHPVIRWISNWTQRALKLNSSFSLKSAKASRGTPEPTSSCSVGPRRQMPVFLHCRTRGGAEGHLAFVRFEDAEAVRECDREVLLDANTRWFHTRERMRKGFMTFMIQGRIWRKKKPTNSRRDESMSNYTSVKQPWKKQLWRKGGPFDNKAFEIWKDIYFTAPQWMHLFCKQFSKANYRVHKKRQRRKNKIQPAQRFRRHTRESVCFLQNWPDRIGGDAVMSLD